MQKAIRLAEVTLLLIFANAVWSQPAAYLRPLVFYDPSGGPYIETSLTILGGSVSRERQANGFRNSVTVSVRLYRDTTLVKANKYNLHGPVFSDTLQPPAFLDCHRYLVPNGRYNLEMEVSDQLREHDKPLVIKSHVEIAISPGKLASSFIQPLERFSKSAKSGPLTRSGYDLFPFNSDFYGEPVKHLPFYYELYHADSALGAGAPLLFLWHLETANGNERLDSYGGFRRAEAAQVNPLLATVDITTLGTGDYALVVEARNASGQTVLTNKYYFTRRNQAVDIRALTRMSEAERIAAFVGTTRNADTLQMYVECLWPIANNVDKDRIVAEATKKEPESMRRFVADFWQHRAGDTANPLALWADYYREVQMVMANFRCGKQKGYNSDRGRVMLQYGFPSQRTKQDNEYSTYPYEIWIYYRLVDRTNGQFFSNRRFVFVNKQLGDDCHILVHSDLRGEVNNPRWQYEVTRRNTEGIGNPDQESPRGTEFNQFQEIYQNPR